MSLLTLAISGGPKRPTPLAVWSRLAFVTHPFVGSQQVVYESGQFLRQHGAVEVGQCGSVPGLQLRLLLQPLPAGVGGEERRLVAPLPQLLLPLGQRPLQLLQAAAVVLLHVGTATEILLRTTEVGPGRWEGGEWPSLRRRTQGRSARGGWYEGRNGLLTSTEFQS